MPCSSIEPLAANHNWRFPRFSLPNAADLRSTNHREGSFALALISSLTMEVQKRKKNTKSCYFVSLNLLDSLFEALTVTNLLEIGVVAAAAAVVVVGKKSRRKPSCRLKVLCSRLHEVTVGCWTTYPVWCKKSNTTQELRGKEKLFSEQSCSSGRNGLREERK